MTCLKHTQLLHLKLIQGLKPLSNIAYYAKLLTLQTFSSKMAMMTCLQRATPSFSPDTTISSLRTLAGGTLMRTSFSSISCLMMVLNAPHTNGWKAFDTGRRSNASFAWPKKNCKQKIDQIGNHAFLLVLQFFTPLSNTSLACKDIFRKSKERQPYFR